MNYKDLDKTQKRVVDAFIALRPELADSPTISRVLVEELFWYMKAQRANGGPKIGYPNFITKGPKIARGLYPFPAPNVVNEDIISVVAKRAAQTSKEDEEFLAELREAGIEA